MTREDIIRMARGTCSQAPREDLETTAWVFGIEGLESFAALVAAAERERIIEKNKPVIEHINAHIKELEAAVAAEREACAQIADIAEPYKCADLIRARGNNGSKI